jgi:hypothetical protein
MISTQVKKNGIGPYRKDKREGVVRINERTAVVIKTVQGQLVPVLTGDLRSTIRIERENNRIYVREGNSVINYAEHVEFGTDSQIAQPHARPAAAEGRKYRDNELKALARER